MLEESNEKVFIKFNKKDSYTIGTLERCLYLTNSSEFEVKLKNLLNYFNKTLNNRKYIK